MRTIALVGTVIFVVICPVVGQEPLRSDSISSADSTALSPRLLLHGLPELHARVQRSSLHSVHTLQRTHAILLGETLADWVRVLPGIQVTGRGSGGPEMITVRGSRAQDVRVTVDGIPIADPLTGVADLSTVPSSSIDMLKLTPGAGAAAGWGGTGGTIELTSRDPRPGVSVRGVIGSFGRQASDVELGWRGHVGSLGVYGSADRADNDYLFRNRIVPEYPVERRANADGASRHLVVRGKLNAIPILMVARSDAVDRGVPGRMGNHAWDAARWNERRSSVSAVWRPGSGPHAALAWSRMTSQYADGRLDRSEGLTANQLITTGRMGLPAGTDLTWEGSWARVHGARLIRETRWTGGIRASRSDAIGGALTLLSAIKLDAAREGIAISPAVGINVLFAPGWMAHGRASQARRLPTFGDLFLRPAMGIVPNAGLGPEYVELDSELGVVWAGQKLEVRTSLFRRSTRDPIVWLPSVVGIWSPRNLGRLDATGVEFYGIWQPWDKWEMRFAGTWQKSRLTFENSTSSSLPYEPELSGSLTLYYQGERRGVLANLTLIGARKANIFAPHELSQYALVNIRGRQTFHFMGVAAELEAGILNALGSVYERMELFPEPGRRVELGVRLLTGSNVRLPVTPSHKSLRNHTPARSGSVQQETKI